MRRIANAMRPEGSVVRPRCASHACWRAGPLRRGKIERRMGPAAGHQCGRCLQSAFRTEHEAACGLGAARMEGRKRHLLDDGAAIRDHDLIAGAVTSISWVIVGEASSSRLISASRFADPGQVDAGSKALGGPCWGADAQTDRRGMTCRRWHLYGSWMLHGRWNGADPAQASETHRASARLTPPVLRGLWRCCRRGLPGQRVRSAEDPSRRALARAAQAFGDEGGDVLPPRRMRRRRASGAVGSGASRCSAARREIVGGREKNLPNTVCFRQG